MCRIAVDCPGMTLSYLPANINLKREKTRSWPERLWFINYYHVKGKTRGEAKTSANKMEDDVFMCKRMKEFALLKFFSGLCRCKSCAILGTRYRSKTTKFVDLAGTDF